METTTLTGRDFNQFPSKARKAANKGPVIITDRGRPAHVLMSMEFYLLLTGAQGKTADFEAPSPSQERAEPADLP